jgi:hypothetical protein
VSRWIANVAGTAVPVRSLGDLRAILSQTASAERQELWLVSRGGPRMCMLRNRDRALLLFQRHGSDTAFTTRARDEVAGPKVVEFTLANGQRDEYPAAWTVDVERAREALEYFFETRAMAPFLAWGEDDEP